MTVFKAILKSVREYKIAIIIYLFVFILFGNMSAHANATNTSSIFKETVLNVAIKDDDNSVISKGLIDYLSSTQEVEMIKTSNYKEINDNIRFGIYNYALILPKDFSSKIKSGNNENTVEYISPGNNASEYLLSEKLRTYLQDVVIYLDSGYSEEEAIKLTKESMEAITKDSPSIIHTNKENDISYFGAMFRFNGYTLLMILCVSIGSILTFMKDKDVKNRISVSGMHFAKRNVAIIGGVSLIGFAITTLVILSVVLFNLSALKDGKILFYAINTYVLMLTGLGMAYMISSVSLNDNIINMVSNMTVLSMSFLCGVFVDVEFLSASIIKLAHFLPLYWYTTATRLVDTTPAGDIICPKYVLYLVIQFTFALIFVAAGLIISRKKEKYAVWYRY